MLILSKFHHNHHPSGVKILAKFARRGFSVINIHTIKLTISIYIEDGNLRRPPPIESALPRFLAMIILLAGLVGFQAQIQ
jgi:hypothetical protein